MITMNSPMACLAIRLNYKLNSMHKLLLTSIILVQEAHETAILTVIFTSIADSLNVNYLPTITQE